MALAEKILTDTWEAWDTSVADLRARLRGELIQPGDREYERARAIHDAAFDRRPVLIVRCAGAADVSATIGFARARGLPLAVRGGGHSVAGHSACDEGVVIDLSSMKGIVIDPVHRVARIEPGLTWGEVAEALQPHGLALTSGDTSSVGVGGLVLGGGIGWMARAYGLTIDRLRAVDLVTAEGHFLRASATEHAELFWGLRGGGGNFGVATAFEFDLHAGGMVFGGAVFYDASEAAKMADVLRAYARIATAAPDELTTIAFIMPAPPVPFIPPDRHGAPVVIIAVCYVGDPAEGARVVAPLRELGAPIADVIGPMPYPAMFALTAEAAVPGHQVHLRSLFLPELDEGALKTVVDQTHAVMSPGTIVQVRVLGGALGRVPMDATAFAHRDKHVWITAMHQGPADADPSELRGRTEQVWRALQPYSAGAYANFLGDEGESRIREAYPPATYARLAAIKARYDPTNLFRNNQNIKPAHREEVVATRN
jgi:FAD/FMN-containing dehydrogenase